jgi:hypothetical protein
MMKFRQGPGCRPPTSCTLSPFFFLMVGGRVSDLYYPDDCHIGEITAAAAGLYLSGRYGTHILYIISDEIDATRKAHQPKDIRHNMMCGM